MRIKLNEKDIKLILVGLERLKADTVWKETIDYYNNLILSIKEQAKKGEG